MTWVLLFLLRIMPHLIMEVGLHAEVRIIAQGGGEWYLLHVVVASEVAVLLEPFVALGTSEFPAIQQNQSRRSGI